MDPMIRTLGRWLSIASLALLLAGCVRVDMELEVSPENTVSGSAILAVDEGILELTGQDAGQLFQDMETTSDLPPGATVESYAEDGFVGQRITFDDVPLSEFSQGGLTDTGEELSIVRRGDEFHVSGQLDMSGSEFGGEQVPPGVLDSVEFRIAITFPGPVRSATGEVDGNTVTWTPRVGENTRIQAVASAIPSSSSLLPLVLIGAGVILLGALVFLLLSRRGTPAPATGAGWPDPSVSGPGHRSGRSTAPLGRTHRSDRARGARANRRARATGRARPAGAAAPRAGLGGAAGGRGDPAFRSAGSLTDGSPITTCGSAGHRGTDGASNVGR